ncbi:cation:proton antiporter [Stenotrophomonas ginsengisoli]|uniref:Cation:proton antiporter n=1 Tax=Stenotrophomonas ginsengisoli TaxID=336566 RepID=A0A0R0D384_9GAMM|nr:Na+/H+ antiporter subunit G [Stenotrophomonas ginsengisoli]KRG76573.1 cation:proton antiporter [Stenotrophomonas ginsengisoli]
MNYEDLFKILLSGVLLFGTFFIVIGAFGLVKLDDFFRRLHAPTKASTLGVGCILAASVGYHLVLGEDPQPRELLITVFLFITAPVSAHLMAKAALSLMIDKRPLPPQADPDQGQCTLPLPAEHPEKQDRC